jgi:hypothetical protein
LIGMTPRVLISPAVRRYFRDVASGWSTLREIGNLWQDEGFKPSGQPNDEQGERRGLWREYEDSINWTDPAHMTRVLRVYESLLTSVDQQQLQHCRQVLDRNGFTLAASGRITPMSGHPATLPSSLSIIRDPSLILDSFDRITRALPDDPAQAIGSAKELIEATAKTVLNELGVPFDDKTAKLPGLVDAAQRALHLHPSMAAPGPDGTNAVKRILGGLTNIAVGLAELRNEGYGTGHAPATPRVGLHPRHAHFAVGAARTWCHLVLDTLADSSAPWRSAHTPATPSCSTAAARTGESDQ